MVKERVAIGGAFGDYPCWSHRKDVWYDPKFLLGVECYDLRFEMRCSTANVVTFLDQWKELFRDTFTFKIEGTFVEIQFDKDKYATLANMYGVMGAMRLIEEASYYIKGYCNFDDKYGDKLNPFQKLLLGHYFHNGGYFNTNHEFYNEKLLEQGKLTLRYFKDTDYFVNKVLGPAVEKGSLQYGVIKGMSTAIYDDRGYEGAPKWYNGVNPAGEFTTLIPFQGRKKEECELAA